MSLIENVSRREFLKELLSGSALVLGVYLTPGALRAAPLADVTPADRAPFHPNVFVGIETDGAEGVSQPPSSGLTSQTPAVVAAASEEQLETAAALAY